MRLLVLMGIGVILDGCSGVPAIRGVHYGMESNQVRGVMGSPDRSEVDPENPNLSSWVYNTDGEVCTVDFFRERVFVPPRCQSPERKIWLEETAQIRANPYTWEALQEKAELEAKEKHARNLANVRMDPPKSKTILYVNIPSSRGTSMVAWDIPVNGRASRLDPLELQNHNFQAILWSLVPFGFIDTFLLFNGAPDRIHSRYVDNQAREADNIRTRVKASMDRNADEVKAAAVAYPQK